MEGFCKGCLIKYDEPTDLLQYTEKNRRLFVYSTSLQVKRNDAFSFQLCKDCYLKMKLACNFKKMCRNSDKRFRNYQALKEAGDELDFCTFIKNKDDSISFRFPLLSGNSTPLHRNNKDDDNESTCTSIRNFMTDIFKADDIPDTEARIIREVIEEEADVLDDSLDSHWLQDDASIDTDFRLDFSFSPFSTPRPENKCHTPPKLNDAPTAEQHELNYYTAKKILQDDIQLQPVVKIASSIEPIILDSLINEKEISKAIDTVLDINTEIPKYEKFYIENDEINKEICNEVIAKKEATECTIDRNLEKALQNEDNQEYCLDDLLVTPPVVSGGSGPSTPTINNIIFGKKLDIDYGNSNSNEPIVGHCIENYVDVEGDVEFFEDFYYKDTEDHVGEDIKNKESKEGVHKTEANENKESEIMYDISKFRCKLCDTKYISARGLNLHFSIVHKTKITSLKKPKIVDDVDTKYDLLNFLCKTCDKKFDSEKALKIHLNRLHKLKLPRAKRTYKEAVCDICGKVYHDQPNLMRHKKFKHEGKVIKCDLCSLKFATNGGLTMHMTTHIGKRALDPPKKTYVCTICGAVSTTSSNLQLHMLRHAKKYMYFCNECGKGFYTKYNLTTHLRSHFGIRPYQCEVCEKWFARRDALNLHMKRHTAETHYECVRCGKKFVRHYLYMSHIKKCPTINLSKETDLSINFVGKNRVISLPAIIEKRCSDSNARKAKQKSDGNAEIDKVVSIPAVEENIETVDSSVTTEIPSTNGNICFFGKDKEIRLPTLVEDTEKLDSTVANENNNCKDDTSVLEHNEEVSLPVIEMIDMFDSTGSKDNNLFEAVSNLVGNSKNISLPIIVADAEV